MKRSAVKPFLSYPPLLVALVAVLLVLSFVPTSEGPAIEALFSRAGLAGVNAAAADHIVKQREQALNGFLVLSALKVGVAVLRSSEIGLILNVRIGDLAVAVYDYVNFAWEVLLAAVVYYYLVELLLALTGTVDIWFLWGALIFSGLALVTGLAWPFRTGVRRAFRRVAVFSGVMALLLYLALPLAMVGAGSVSRHITGGTINEATGYFEDVRDNMPGFSAEGEAAGKEGAASAGVRTPSVTVPFPYDGSDPSRVVIEDGRGTDKSLADVLAGIVSGDRLSEMSRYLEHRSRVLASHVMRQTAAYLFNIVVFPLLTLLLLYLVGKFLISLDGPAPRRGMESR